MDLTEAEAARLAEIHRLLAKERTMKKDDLDREIRIRILGNSSEVQEPGDGAFLIRLLDEARAELHTAVKDRDVAHAALADLITDPDSYEAGRKAGLREAADAIEMF